MEVFLLHSLCKANELCFIVFKRAFAPSLVFDVAENGNFTILSYLVSLLREKNFSAFNRPLGISSTLRRYFWW